MAQDSEPGSKPYSYGDAQRIYREFEVRDEDGRYIGILLVQILRKEIPNAIEERVIRAGLHGLDERKLPPEDV
jgi:hypothetical protein